MSRDDANEGENDENGDEAFWRGLRDFFVAYKNDIGSIIRAIAKNVEEGPRLKFKAMISTFGLLAFIVLVLGYLTTQHVVSGDAFAFLVGAIVGYLFSFLRHYVLGVATS